MRRVLGFVFHNWPLKLAAVVLASLLYAGLVLSQNAQTWRGNVPIIPLRQPASVFLVGQVQDVTSIRYFAPPDVAARLSSASFTATMDLSGATVTPENPFVTVKVDVKAADERVQILDYEPQVLRVQLDPLISKSVPVEVSRGAVPAGLQVFDPVLSSSSVTVSGPESVVHLVTAAQARVLIQPSGLDVDQQVDLIAVDASGNAMTPVDLEPSSVRVQIRVGSQLQSRTLPVNPVVVGTPAAGYEIASVSVTPSVTTVDGEADALANLARIDTAPVSLSGASSTVTTTVQLALPPNVGALAGGTAQVTVQLRQTTGTRTFQAGVTLVGARSDRLYALSVSQVTITVGGTTGALQALNPATISALAEAAGLGIGPNEVGLRVALPQGISLVAISPPSIVVTVSVPATPAPTTGLGTEPSAVPGGQ